MIMAVMLTALLVTSALVSAADPVTVQLGVWGAQVDIDNITEQVRRFEELHPDIKVDVTVISGDTIAGYMTRIAGGVAPDVFYPGNWFLGEFAEQDVFLDLGPYIERDGIDMDQFAPSAVEAMQWKGVQWALPVGFHTEALYYNKDLFDQAGVGYPAADWDWDAYLAAAIKLTQDRNQDGETDQWGAFVEFWIPGFQPFFLQNGANLINEEHTRAVLDSPEAIETLQFLRDMVWDYQVAPTPEVRGQMDGPVMFASGILAMGNFGHWNVPRMLNADVSFDWDVQVLPKRKYQASTVHVHGYGIYRGTQYPEEAWTLVKWLATDGAVPVSDLVPARIELATSPEFLGGVPANHRAFLDMAMWPHTQQPPFGPKYSKWAGILSRELGKIWLNWEPVENVVGDLSRQITAILTE